MTRKMSRYKDRAQAGIVLGNTLAHHVFSHDVVVLALPRGGVPVAEGVARILHAPLDLLVVRKIGAPGHPELACGAIATGGIVIWNYDVLETLSLGEHDLDDIREEEERELRRRESTLRGIDAPPLDISARTVILVDDGLATGASMKAAIQAVQTMKPAEIVAAFPVGPERSCRDLEQLGCKVVCPIRVNDGCFSSVGQWYEDFSQVPSSECKRILVEYRHNPALQYRPSAQERPH